jgi:hypothetical protein
MSGDSTHTLATVDERGNAAVYAMSSLLDFPAHISLRESTGEWAINRINRLVRRDY